MKLSIFCWFLLLPIYCSSQSVQDVQIASITCVSIQRNNDQCTQVKIGAKLYLPPQPTRTLITITHGSGGVDARHPLYAKRINEKGFAALLIDHWSGRGITAAHFDYLATNAKGARSFNQSIDALRAMNAFNSLPMNFDRFGFIGESMGGGAALWFQKKYLYDEYRRLFGSESSVIPNAVVGLYPACEERINQMIYNKVPILIIAGELDNDTPASNCVKYKEWNNQRHGGNIKLIVLPGQHHDFDAPYSLTSSDRVQNPSRCVSEIDQGIRTWDENGEKFQITPQGYRDYQNKCVQPGTQAPVLSGNTGNPETGFLQWLDFFTQTIQANP
jgi:dienelactone hydrolase